MNEIMQKLLNYGQFGLEWYLCILMAFLGLYGVLTLKSSFRRLAALIVLFSAALPTMLISGEFTGDLYSTQAMLIALLIIQALIAFAGLLAIKETIPQKLFKSGIKKEK